MRKYGLVFLISFLSCCSDPSFAQSAEKEPQAVLEIGGAASRSLTESQSSFGPTLAVVADPVRITVRAPKRSASRPIAKVEKAAIKLCVVNASEIAEPRA
ncbi:MAG TPA: hypothetical protein VMP68_09685 [Candidatus Eisenbacteria bacterium]|nr:hypothetical protein [Candidatus Eisenbacteria bacterium]